MGSITLEFNRRVVPKQSARFYAIPQAFGKPRIRSNTDPKVTQFERNILYEALAQRPRDFKKLTGPIYAQVKYIFKVPTSFTAAVKQSILAGKVVYKITTPDLMDNISKAVFDALKGHLFGDDCTICKYTAEKVYGTADKIILKLTEL